jgi:hypothetical protein
MMLDLDLAEMPASMARPASLAEARRILVEVAPQIADAPMLAFPSAGANLFETATGREMRGLTGIRLYVLVAHAATIPALGKRLHERLVLRGAGFAFISKAGTITVRSALDSSVWSPERLDFISGADCGAGVEQRRGTPVLWNSDAPAFCAESVPALQDGERKELARLASAIVARAQPLAQRRRAEHLQARQATGREFNATWREDGTVESLNGDHELMLTDGSWVSVSAILDNPDRYHGQTCADPLDPEYRGDRRIAQIYTRDQSTGPRIHSFAHGGATYLLRRSAQEEFAVTAPVEESFSTEAEALASLVGDPGRVLMMSAAGASKQSDLMSLYDALAAASKRNHPLRRVLDEVVLPEGKTLGRYTTDVVQFSRLLNAALLQVAGWQQLDDSARTLLLRAAYVLLAPVTELAAADRQVPRLVDGLGAPRTLEVDPIIPQESVVALIGPPGSGKSTLASEIAARMGVPPALDARTGRGQDSTTGSWKVEHGTVVSFLSEDTIGRSEWRRKWSDAHAAPNDWHLISGVPPLSNLSDSVSFVRHALGLVLSPDSAPVRLLIIDLFRDAFDGEENSSADVGAAMATAHALARMFRCSILLVHHSAIANEQRGRGSSAFSGGLDVCCAVAIRDGTITATVTKNRGGPTGATYSWHFESSGLLGAGSGASRPTEVTEDSALSAARVIREIATPGIPVTRTALAAGLADARPDLFGEHVNPNTAKTRVARGINAAVEKRWIAVDRGKFIPGPNEPPQVDFPNELSAIPADLAAVLA